MRRLTLAAIAALCSSAAAVAQEGSRYAVLVGVNTYEHGKLPALRYAVNDAVELGEVLSKGGYAVTVLSDDAGKGDPKLGPTKANVERAVKTVLAGAKREDLVLVGLAGHGLQFEGDKDAYFCPSDARPSPTGKDSLVSLTRLYADLDDSFAGMKVLLVDACRDDPSLSRGVTADASPRPPSGIAAILSCKAGQRSFEHPRLQHGVFFYHVIAGLRGEAADRKGRVTFGNLASHVGREVPEDVARLVGNGAKQSPNLKAEYADEPVLLVTHGGSAVGRPVDPVGADLRAYERALLTGEVEAFFKDASGKVAGWRKAAEVREPAGQVLYAACLRTGMSGVTKDETAAVAWYRKAAEQGSSAAMTSLGWAYFYGQGVATDRTEAVRWYRMAADRGSPVGMENLSYSYAHGEGAPRDNAAAFQWLKGAADAGLLRAAVQLAKMYHAGQGVPRDDREAARWYRLAAANGNLDARAALERLGRAE